MSARKNVFASGVIVATGAAIACGVISIPSEPMAPVNTCTDDPSCAAIFPDAGAGSCTGSACSTTAFPGGSPFLVVAIPRDVANFGGVTMPLPANYAVIRGQFAQKGTLPSSSLGACLPAQQNAPLTECDPLPPLTQLGGPSGGAALQVKVGFDATLVPNGLRPNQPATLGGATSLPVNVTVEMLWKDPATGNYAPARKLGIALDDVAGFLSSTSFLDGPTNGDASVPGFEIGAKVPQPLSPADPMNAYRLYLAPPAPYESIPPLLIFNKPSQIAQAGLGAITQSLKNDIPTYDTPTADGGSVMQHHAYVVNEAAGAPSLEGWTLHIDDQNGHRVSGKVVLDAGASKTVDVYEATGTQAQSGLTPLPDQYVETLYIDPPPGKDLPRYVAEAPVIVGPFTYVALPPPVTLTGSVRTVDGQATTAHVTFVANGDDPDQLLEADLVMTAPFFLYSKTVMTASTGEYTATLPPGTLRVYVAPDDPSLALTVFDKPVSPSSPLQAGQTLTVNRRSHVKGRVVLANGLPVFAADVIVSASADAPFTTKDDPLARPREVRGTTDKNGLFDVPSDSGFVDISVRPHDGTKLPWVVLANRVVPPSDGADGGGEVTLSLADVVIPEPARYTQAASGVLTDAAGNLIARAVVRAYAFPPPVTGVDGGAAQTRGARLIGMTTTGDDGTFQLFVVPPQ